MGTYVGKIENNKNGIIIFSDINILINELDNIIPKQLSFIIGTKRLTIEKIKFIYEILRKYKVVNLYSLDTNKRMDYICSYLPHYKDEYNFFGFYKSMNNFIEELQTLFFLDNIEIKESLINNILIKLRILKSDNKTNIIILNFENDELKKYDKYIEKIINLYGSNFHIILSTDECLDSFEGLKNNGLEDI